MLATPEIKIEKAEKVKWETIKLGDLLEKISNGYGGTQIQEKNEYPITRIETISDGTINLHRVRYAKEISEAEIEKYRLKDGDLLFSHINSDHHLGKTALYKKQYEPLIQGINLLLLRPNNKVISPYLNFVLNYLRWKGDFSKIAQHAVNQSSLNQSKIKNVDIPLPGIAIQHRIVEKIEELFSELDYAITTLKTTQQQLQTYRQSVLKYAFEGHFTGGMKGWKEEQLGTLSEYITSGSRGWAKYYSETGDFFLRITNLDFDSITLDLEPNKIQYVKLDGVKEGIRTEVQKDDILISITGYLGMTAIVPSNIPRAFVNQHICLVRLKKQYYSKFIAYFISSNSGGHRQFNIAGKGATKAGLTLQDIRNLKIPIPEINVQKKIVNEIETRLSKSDYLLQTINQQLIHAESLRQSILQRAFSGEL